MHPWASDSFFYHIYPLGLCGAPQHNSPDTPAVPRLAQLQEWTPHLQQLGVNAIYLGPLFESHSHGYDTIDYATVDRRLGSNATLAELVAHYHRSGIRIILDGVFNHVGRGFWAFRDLCKHGQGSQYRDWFAGVDFGGRSPCGDSFTYETWGGHYELVKLNLHHPEVRAYLFGVVARWVEEFDIDGLRLDAADVMDIAFLSDLAQHCRSLRPDFFLLGEVIHGDYTRWAGPGRLDATTNYECYKGLYSSLNDVNYFEIAYALSRQFGEGGMYRDLPLYTFADNHDVNRLASTLHNPAHLYPLHALMFTMPGVPSIYYGSEWGIEGSKSATSDAPLRPALPSPAHIRGAPHPDLAHAIERFARLRREHAALRHGDYQQLLVRHEQLAFARAYGDEVAVVVLNAAAEALPLQVPTSLPEGTRLVDVLDAGPGAVVRGGAIHLEQVPSCWARVLLAQRG